MWEIALIAIVALLVVGPDKLPEAAKKISSGIRDFRKSTRELTKNIEEDTELGSAVRDLKSALRGDDLRQAVYQPPHLRRDSAKKAEGADGGAAKPDAAGSAGDAPASTDDTAGSPGAGDPAPAPEPSADDAIDDLPGDPDLPVLATPADTIAQSAGSDDGEPAPRNDDPASAEAGKAHG